MFAQDFLATLLKRAGQCQHFTRLGRCLPFLANVTLEQRPYAADSLRFSGYEFPANPPNSTCGKEVKAFVRKLHPTHHPEHMFDLMTCCSTWV
jgi:hypothetical protein